MEVNAVHLDLLVGYGRSLTGAKLRDLISRLRRESASSAGRAIRVLVTDYLSPSMQETLRAGHVPFLDSAGNAWLVHAGVHIDRRGYVARRQDGLSLRHPGELLEDWLHAYRGREAAATATYFAPVTSAARLIEAAQSSELAHWHDYALTRQAGANLVSRYAEFDAAEVYVRHESVADGIATQLGARPVSRGANLVIMAPYCRVSAFYGERRLRGLNVVSDLQLYLDLYDFP